MNRDEAIQMLLQSPLVEGHEQLRRGHVRLQTLFRFPDGSLIDLFVRAAPDTQGRAVLSDLGTTANWLSMLGIAPPYQPRRVAMIEGIREVCGIRQNSDALERVIGEGKETPVQVLVQLATGCIRYADLMFTRKAQDFGDFKDRVETTLIDNALEYETGVPLKGVHDREVVVDFLVTGGTTKSAVLTMGAKSTATAKSSARNALARLVDLRERPEQRVVLYDDQTLVWPPEEIERLADNGSSVFAFSEHDQWRELLAA